MRSERIAELMFWPFLVGLGLCAVGTVAMAGPHVWVWWLALHSWPIRLVVSGLALAAASFLLDLVLRR